MFLKRGSEVEYKGKKAIITDFRHIDHVGLVYTLKVIEDGITTIYDRVNRQDFIFYNADVDLHEY